MRKFLKLFGASVAGFGCVVGVNAADVGRGAYNVNTLNRGGVSNVQRMPTMPTLPINSIGNLTENIPTGGGNNPTPPPSKCPDGGVAKSDYTVDNCMNDVMACINNGALPGGLNDLFNPDLRNSIMNGMGLCSTQVDKCISTVRLNCAYVYRTSADVWIDFNSRKIQPEYFSFVLRKTGLTPNQAENTCMLLDKNTFGSSFSAVDNNGNVTTEYANGVNGYNGAGPAKNAPQGVKVNNGNPGVDGQRGHYARWDATNAECLVRVAAYNKDSYITNDWLFGALGDSRPAEAWKAAGSGFSCNKDLFGFSLMNNTSTVAVVGIGGGTVVGGTVGAIAGHGARAFDCMNKNQREELTKQLRTSGKTGVLNEYLDGVQISASGDIIDESQCEEIVKLYDVYQMAKTADKSCVGGNSYDKSTKQTAETVYLSDFQKDVNGVIDYTKVNDGTGVYKEINPLTDQQIQTLNSPEYNGITVVYKDVIVTENNSNGNNCPQFNRLNKAKEAGVGIYCTANTGCISGQDFAKEASRLGTAIEPLKILQGEKSNVLKSAAIGAGVGAGAGGLATAITAFVEKNNISCRVGDGLEKVGFGKSYSIGTLKDFYVKWNLRLPDTVQPTAKVIDCPTWRNACGSLTNLNECAIAQINYRPTTSNNTVLVSNACSVSGSVCIENHTVAVSQGACPQ